VQFLAKSVASLKISRKNNYLTFDFDLRHWDQGQKIWFLFSFLWLLYGASFSKISAAVQDLSQNKIIDL